jgi:ABC-type glycerol-3-phosphate transport system substrate-binding protein
MKHSKIILIALAAALLFAACGEAAKPADTASPDTTAEETTTAGT